MATRTNFSFTQRQMFEALNSLIHGGEFSYQGTVQNTGEQVTVPVDIVEAEQWIAHKVAQLDKKSTTERKLTPHQQENEKIKEDLLDNMENGVRYTIGDMLITFDCFPIGMTPNRLSALLSQLGAKGTNQIVRTEVKGKAYFEKA